MKQVVLSPNAPSSILVCGVKPAAHPADRVVVDLPGALTIGTDDDGSTLIVTRFAGGERDVTRVPLDRPARLARVIDETLLAGETQLWLGDRARLIDRLGRPPVDIERALAALAVEHEVLFVGWTGKTTDAIAAADAYEEIRDADASSDLPGAHRARE